MIALSTVLSFIKIFRLPYGGSVTAFSMVPVLFIGYIFGIKAGIGAGCVYGIIQAIQGAVSSSFAGISGWSVAAVLLLDFLLAFGALGFSGIFKNKISKPSLSFALGALVAGALRYLCHFLSGVIVYGSYAEWFFSQETVTFGGKILDRFSGLPLATLYSAIYSATYMIPEIIISVFLCALLVKIPRIGKICAAGKLM